MAVIEVSGLTKDYGPVLANDDLHFTVEEGEVFGYLGPNGAGKTTTIRTLMGFQSPTAGTATLLGRDVRDDDALIEAKRDVGYLPATPAFDENLTGREVLDLHAAIKGDDRREELLELFDPPLDRTIREYSTGNVQKLGLVQAFMHDPNLVIMDEPTSGLDPLMQQRFNEFVREEKARGTTVFLSSHVLSEVRRVCDRVGILREGRLVTTERVENLLHRSGKLVRARALDGLGADDFAFDGVHDVDVSTTTADGEANLTVNGRTVSAGQTISEVSFTYTGDVNALLDVLADHALLDVDVQEAPIEEVFMRFYGDDEAAASAGDDDVVATVGGDADA